MAPFQQWHKLSDKNLTDRTANCRVCGPVKIKSCGLNNQGKRRWKCRTIFKKYSKRRSASAKYRRHLKAFCESCGFVPVNHCQLDIHHKNGNHKDNSPENLQTLCANCHRLV